MKTIVCVLAVLGLSFGIGYGRATRGGDSGSPETIEQIEGDWVKAMIDSDIAKLSSAMADDYIELGSDGTKSTKSQILSAFKSGKLKMISCELGPMDVKVIGDVAIVQGSDTEKSSYEGKDTSGTLVWTDVFVNRDGKWQALRSQEAKPK